MFNNAAFELQKQYTLGERDFRKAQLRRAELQGMNLSHIDLRGADLSCSNLKEADLSYANLQGCYLNEANLIGANLKGANLKEAYLIKTYLTRANLQEACLAQAYLTGAFLTKVNLTKADLTGALLNGADLSGARLQGAFYNEKTCLDRGIEPGAIGMEKKTSLTTNVSRKTTVAELLKTLKAVVECGNHYLGSTLTLKYINSSRPEFDWLQHFEISRTGTITFSGSINSTVTTLQLKWFEEWMKKFIKSCSFIVQDFPKIIAEKNLQSIKSSILKIA